MKWPDQVTTLAQLYCVCKCTDCAYTASSIQMYLLKTGTVHISGHLHVNMQDCSQWLILISIFSPTGRLMLRGGNHQ